ncbi:hypothetical protein [Pseudoalteromonas piscicida]|uniref:Uncharacterized protein n=1 Tax=Pseudoalteromonas piscicida TaxID=43662 RepID=A0AAD0W2W0_PSEO7|nr:hypothetical protein [Pseudoalteromonas piscicida]ASD67641.1 hypothetical protein B1L02_11855 [Pseudoalteromonas piscicida]AXR01655.1 hypothetical protein D0511_05890 [Pseudoalteromonas piscicida]
MYNYAHVDSDNVVVGCYQFDEAVDVEHYIQCSNASLGDIYNPENKQFHPQTLMEEPPVEHAEIILSDVALASSSARLIGNIWWVAKNDKCLVTASVTGLPDIEIMIMIERVVNATQPVEDIRFIANVENGTFTLALEFDISGNYLLSAERVNRGLERIGAPFRLIFETMEFDVYLPAVS